ncbi:phosphoribosyltransferase family protein [Flavobacterium ardleyense]|uniref:Phosphoribosyltransferase family protein n=1 Tax=Flavobacterium ardleyense TaxID=2038737 RepID=A0ABW5Z4J9_9FLAO
MNKSYSLHKIESVDALTFSPSDYSWFKFGDRYYAKSFAKELFDDFILNHGDIILEQEEVIVLPSPYLSIPTASNFLCYYFKEYLNIFLFNNNRKATIESKIYRNQTYVTDYGNLDFEERIKLISNDTYYLDKEFINDKFCIFVDDIKITGSHEHTINKILNQYNVDGKFLFVYFAELTNKEIHPNIENFFNYFAVKGVEEIIEVVNRADFQYNTRIIKFILNFEENDLNKFLENITFPRREELFALAISNNYHHINEYINNLKTIKSI